MEDGGYADPVTGLSQEQRNELSQAMAHAFLDDLPDVSEDYPGSPETRAEAEECERLKLGQPRGAEQETLTRPSP